MRFCPRCGTRFEAAAFCPHDGEATQELPGGGDAPDPLLGQVVDGRYRVEKQIGEGGMGVVYKATHTALNKPLALKILRGEMAKDQSVVQRFIQEAQAATSIGHQNIIDISDFGKLPDGSVYFVMEFLDGHALTDLVSRGGPAPVGTSVHIVRQMASAVGAAHNRGIVHRDLKPDNIFLIKRAGRDDFVKVLDFGIAKVGGASNKLTQTGMVFGTPHYMSPEQAAGQSVDLRTDIYALGVIMYELFTGHVPFDADTFMGVLTKHMFEEPPPMLRSGDERLLGALELVTFKALAKKPENRYQTMQELLDDLDRVMGGETPQARAGGGGALADELEPRSISEMHLERRMGDVGATTPSGRGKLSPKAALMLGGGLASIIVAAAIAVVVTMDDGSGPIGGTGARSGDTGGASPPAASFPAQPTAQAQARVGEGSPDGQLVLVEVATDPTGASVVVDGAIIGATPAKLPRPRGTRVREVQLRMDGYRAQQLRLTASSPGQILVPLVKAPEHHRAHQSHTPRAQHPSAPAPAPAKPRRRRSEVLDPWGE